MTFISSAVIIGEWSWVTGAIAWYASIRLDRIRFEL